MYALIGVLGFIMGLFFSPSFSQAMVVPWNDFEAKWDLEGNNCRDTYPPLDHLVEQKLSRTRVFITYHDKVGARAIQRFSCNFSRKWIIPVFCNATKYFEYYAYKEFSKLSLAAELKDVDYVIMTGYKTLPTQILDESKVGVGVYLTEEKDLHTLIEFASLNPEYDYLPFFTDHKSYNVSHGLQKCHGPDALPALIASLKGMNWTEAEITAGLGSLEFYRNTYLIKASVFLDLAKEVSKFIDVIENDPQVGEMYRKDAKYGADRIDVAMKAFGTPYYQLHCFIVERILTVLLTHLKAKTPIYPVHAILDLTDKRSSTGKRKVNSLLIASPDRVDFQFQTFHSFTDCMYLLSTLDALTEYKGTRTKMFVSYQDEIGEEAIRHFTCNSVRKWVAPVFNQISEYSVYQPLSKMTALADDLKEVDYVILIGYKTLMTQIHERQKSRFSPIDFMLQSVIEFAEKHPQFDVVPFYPLKKPLARSLEDKTIQALHFLLKEGSSFSETEISKGIGLNEFHRNTYLARTNVFLKVVNMMKQLTRVIESNNSKLEIMITTDRSFSFKGWQGSGSTDQQISQEYKMLMDAAVPVVLNLMNAKTATMSFGGVLHTNETRRKHHVLNLPLHLPVEEAPDF